MSTFEDNESRAISVMPDKIKLNGRQALRFSKLSGVEVKEVEGLTIADLAEKLKWKIDPALFLFQRICGKVVKTDPITGIDYPVPFATVHVMDTNCSFLGLFPGESPWAWFFPLFCHQEEIGSTVTDACGNFYVWIPRFEVNWILQWRIEQHCYEDLFTKPSIRDILEHLEVIERQPQITPDGPRPYPGPVFTKDARAFQRVGELIGRNRAEMLWGMAQLGDFTGNTLALHGVLDKPAFPEKVPPPVPKQLQMLYERYRKEGDPVIQDLVGQLPERMTSFNLQNYIGPFPRSRCRWAAESELVPILNAPDITFIVTQDVDHNGTQETIYTESFFDVRWNTNAIPDVTLHASQIALSTFSCEPMPVVDCTQLGTGFGIVSLGSMSLHGPTTGTPYYDATSGYALRPNPPHADGMVRPSTPADRPATAPFAGVLYLRGCNKFPNAAFYRMWYKFNGGPPTMFLNQSWPISPGGIPMMFAPDTNGWYPILSQITPDLLFVWPSYTFPSGDYEIWMEVGDTTKNRLADSATIKLKVDNSRPSGSFLGLAWREAQDNTKSCTDDSCWKPLSLSCPVVPRPANMDIEFCLTWQVSAPHLLYAEIMTSVCGSDPSALTQRTAMDTVQHWYTGEFDNNTGVRSAIYRLTANNQGNYTFAIAAFSRAFNPSDSMGNAADWFYDSLSLASQVAYLPVSVVNS